MINDMEAQVDLVIGLFKSKLGAVITAINAERTDFSIDDIDSSAWFYQNLRNDFFNYEPFVVYGIADINVDDTCQNNAIKTVKIFVEIGLTDHGEDKDEEIFRKLLRYTKALEQVFFQNQRAMSGMSNPLLESLLPLTGVLDGKRIHVAGIQITSSLTAT